MHDFPPELSICIFDFPNPTLFYSYNKFVLQFEIFRFFIFSYLFLQNLINGTSPEVDYEAIFAAASLSPTTKTKFSSLPTITDMVLYRYNNLTLGILADESGILSKVGFKVFVFVNS